MSSFEPARFFELILERIYSAFELADLADLFPIIRNKALNTIMGGSILLDDRHYPRGELAHPLDMGVMTFYLIGNVVAGAKNIVNKALFYVSGFPFGNHG